MKSSTGQWLATAGFLVVVAITVADRDFGIVIGMLIGSTVALAILAFRKHRHRSHDEPSTSVVSSRLTLAFAGGAAASVFIYALAAGGYAFAASVPLVFVLTFGLRAYHRRNHGWPRRPRLRFLKRLWLLAPLLLTFALFTIVQSEYVLVGVAFLVAAVAFSVRAHHTADRSMIRTVPARWLLIPFFLTAVMMGLAHSSVLTAIPIMFVLTLATLGYLPRGAASPPGGESAGQRA